MTLSELAEAANLPVATVKYYLREGLLPPGTPVTRTRADYGAGHLDRLRLVRALVDAAGLSIADARRIVAVVDDPPQRRSELLGIAHGALPSRHRDHEVSDEARRFVAGLGWTIDPDTPALHDLTGALEAARTAGIPVGTDQLTAMADGCATIAEADVDLALTSGDASDAVRVATAGTVLTDPIVAAMRRLAHQHVARRRLD